MNLINSETDLGENLLLDSIFQTQSKMFFSYVNIICFNINVIKPRPSGSRYVNRVKFGDVVRNFIAVEEISLNPPQNDIF